MKQKKNGKAKDVTFTSKQNNIKQAASEIDENTKRKIKLAKASALAIHKFEQLYNMIADENYVFVTEFTSQIAELGKPVLIKYLRPDKDDLSKAKVKIDELRKQSKDIFTATETLVTQLLALSNINNSSKRITAPESLTSLKSLSDLETKIVALRNNEQLKENLLIKIKDLQDETKLKKINFDGNTELNEQQKQNLTELKTKIASLFAIKNENDKLLENLKALQEALNNKNFTNIEQKQLPDVIKTLITKIKENLATDLDENNKEVIVKLNKDIETLLQELVTLTEKNKIINVPTQFKNHKVVAELQTNIVTLREQLREYDESMETINADFEELNKKEL